MVSKQIINIIGLQINVFGLDEYRQLPEDTPLCAMFFCTGVKMPQEFIAEQCKAMCTLNESRKPNDRYLIVISLDCPNIGTRKRYRDDVMQETDLISEEYFPKMYLHAKSTAYSMSLIIECFDIYVFGEHSKLYVEKWGITGFSMGGIAAALAHTIEPKITTIIMIASSLRYEKWCEHLSKTFGFVDRFYKLERTARLIDAKTENFISDLKDVKLLLLNGEKDRRVSLPEEKIGVEELRKVHNGQEGHDWKYMILPVRIHNVEKPYMIEAMKWTKKWMILIDEIMQSKI